MYVYLQEEEFDVHSRAETYSADIHPETSYYMIPSEKENINTINYSDFAPAARKRRKHLAIIDNFILISPLGRYCPEHDNIVTLPNGKSNFDFRLRRVCQLKLVLLLSIFRT